MLHSSGEKTVIELGNVVRTANGSDFVVLGMKFHYRVEESLSKFIRTTDNFLEAGRLPLVIFFDMLTSHLLNF